MLMIVPVRAEPHIQEVQQLFSEFLQWHIENAGNDIDLVHQHFDDYDFDAEIENLPGPYRAPEGHLFLASCYGASAGCVAVRSLQTRACEMKRLFVRSKFMGEGIGRALLQCAIEAARASGYTSIKLDTGAHQITAQSLYRNLGFEVFGPYYEIRPEFDSWLRFFGLKLT